MRARKVNEEDLVKRWEKSTDPTTDELYDKYDTEEGYVKCDRCKKEVPEGLTYSHGDKEWCEECSQPTWNND